MKRECDHDDDSSKKKQRVTESENTRVEEDSLALKVPVEIWHEIFEMVYMFKPVFMQVCKHFKDAADSMDISKKPRVNYFSLDGVVITLDFVKYMLNNYLCKDAHDISTLDTKILYRAARYGNLEILYYLSQLLSSHFDNITCNRLMYEGAVRGGHFHVMKSIQEGIGYFPVTFINKNTCKKAAKGGHIDILKFFKEQNLPHDHERDDFDYNPTYAICWNSVVPSTAIKNGHLDIIKWLNTEEDVTFVISLDKIASRHGQVKILDWLAENGHLCNLFGCAHDATEHGHINILEYVKRNGYCPRGHSLCKTACNRGNIKILEWLKENIDHSATATWNSINETYTYDVNEGGCPLGPARDCYKREALKKGRHDIANWLDENYIPKPEV